MGGDRGASAAKGIIYIPVGTLVPHYQFIYIVKFHFQLYRYSCAYIKHISAITVIMYHVIKLNQYIII